MSVLNSLTKLAVRRDQMSKIKEIRNYMEKISKEKGDLTTHKIILDHFLRREDWRQVDLWLMVSDRMTSHHSRYRRRPESTS